MSDHGFVPYAFERLPPERMLERARAFNERMDARRSVRDFSPDPVPRELIELAVRAASSAPSGAHRQPWTFVLVGDAQLKREIRIAAEREERASYEQRMSDEWLEALRPLGTDWRKPYLETVPWIVVVFEQLWGEEEDGDAASTTTCARALGSPAASSLRRCTPWVLPR